VEAQLCGKGLAKLRDATALAQAQESMKEDRVPEDRDFTNQGSDL
jgi:hypothetical protein